MSLAELFSARQARRTRTHSRRSAFVFDALEPRLLLSADPIVATLTATLVDAVDDTSTTAEDTSVTIDVLANDIDASSLAITGFTNGAHGTVTMVASQLVYTPDPNYHGTDTFTYTAEHAAPGGQTAPGSTVLANAITLPTLNFAFDPPALVATDQYAGTGLVFGPDAVGVFDEGIAAWTGLSDFFGTGLVADNRSPIAGSFVMPNTTTDATTTFLQVEVGLAAANTLQLEVFDVDGNLLGSALNGSANTGPHGRALVDITATGIHSFRVSRTADGVTVDEDWAMTQITFGELTALSAIDTATVTVTVTPVNDPPAATDDAATTNEDTPVTVDVLANDSDIDADALAISGFTNGVHGTVALVSGTLVYTPAPNFHGADVFSYTVDDGHGGTDSASVAITVASVNDTPDAGNDAATTNEDTAITIAVLPNDTDLDGDTRTITGVGTAGMLGEVTINGDGTLTYDPNGQFESLGVGQTATDTFTYTIGDGHGGADTATVTVTITGVADGSTPVIHLSRSSTRAASRAGPRSSGASTPGSGSATRRPTGSRTSSASTFPAITPCCRRSTWRAPG
jgi:VCBS repeat-containing protein